jgi:hypothetical protein
MLLDAVENKMKEMASKLVLVDCPCGWKEWIP